MSRLNRAIIDDFQKVVWDYYHEHGRDLPWRHPKTDGVFDAYKILVSEIMLQQTQVTRVIPKYESFLKRFPTPADLSQASLSEVLSMWSGLGYNRRAKYLHDGARVLAKLPGPWPVDALRAVKGIGPNTAAAVAVYAYNQPLPFIETNIRSVYIHHFFADETAIADRAILKKLEQTMDKTRPREWYWALMDYGSYLKSSVGNTARLSKTYVKQSTFKGSRRELRGKLIRQLQERGYTISELRALTLDDRLEAVLEELLKEGLLARSAAVYYLA